MSRFDALVAAISMLEHPHAAKLARNSRLPEGVTFLLEIAAGDAQALSRATHLTGRTEATLQKAAGFFIEQVLLYPGGDSYRILGSDRGTSLGELRRNMALIMRWLHPDVASNAASPNLLDRSLFASRITRAWETVKTDERRAAYNISLATKDSPLKRGKSTRALTKTVKMTHRIYARKDGSSKQLVMQRIKSEGFWNRLRLLLGRGHE
jgi:hypothetical protein